MQRRHRRLFRNIVGSPFVEGIAIGIVGTQALDWLSIWLYERENRGDRLVEDSAREGRQVYEVAAAQMASLFGRTLTRGQEKRWGWRFHKAFGIAGGIGFALLRRKDRRVGAGLGLAFGAAFFLLGDELMMPLLGWSPGPRAFPLKTHARGAAAHVAYGVAAEATARLLDRAIAAI